MNYHRTLEQIENDLIALQRLVDASSEETSMSDVLRIERIATLAKNLRYSYIQADRRSGLDVRSVGVRHHLTDGRISQIINPKP